MIVSIKIALSLMVACMMLSSCGVIIDPTIGQGPITLSSDVEKAFADYKATQVPRYFAVSTDGQAYYYSFCDEGRCLRQVKTNVVSECEVFSKGVPCKIYGSHGKIVWATQN